MLVQAYNIFLCIAMYVSLTDESLLYMTSLLTHNSTRIVVVDYNSLT